MDRDYIHELLELQLNVRKPEFITNNIKLIDFNKVENDCVLNSQIIKNIIFSIYDIEFNVIYIYDHNYLTDEKSSYIKFIISDWYSTELKNHTCNAITKHLRHLSFNIKANLIKIYKKSGNYEVFIYWLGIILSDLDNFV